MQLFISELYCQIRFNVSTTADSRTKTHIVYYTTSYRIAPEMKYYWLLTLSSLSTIGSVGAFIPASTIGADCSKSRSGYQRHITSSLIETERNNELPQTVTTLWNEKKKKGGLDESMRNKLVTESIAPWRTLRLFLYFSLGSGAFIGGLINGSGAIAASASPEFNLQTEVRTIECDMMWISE